MKIKLEDKEFSLKANGYFLKKYGTEFKGNLTVDLLNAIHSRNFLLLAQITYCAIEDCEQSFDEWLNSFETPLFLASAYDDLTNYFTREFEPTVKAEEKKAPKQEMSKAKA